MNKVYRRSGVPKLPSWGSLLKDPRSTRECSEEAGKSIFWGGILRTLVKRTRARPPHSPLDERARREDKRGIGTLYPKLRRWQAGQGVNLEIALPDLQGVS